MGLAGGGHLEVGAARAAHEHLDDPLGRVHATIHPLEVALTAKVFEAGHAARRARRGRLDSRWRAVCACFGGARAPVVLVFGRARAAGPAHSESTSSRSRVQTRAVRSSESARAADGSAPSASPSGSASRRHSSVGVATMMRESRSWSSFGAWPGATSATRSPSSGPSAPSRSRIAA
eukprot:1321577-Prymnesium_polylepis.2